MDAWRAGLRVFLLVLVVALVVLLRKVLVVAFLGLLIGVVLGFPVRLLSRAMPRGAAVLLTLVLAVGGVAALGYAAYQPLSDQVGQLEQSLPRALDKAEGWFRRAQRNGPIARVTRGAGGASAGGSGAQAAAPSRTPVEGWLGSAVAATGKAAVSVTELLGMIFVIVVLGAFLVADPASYREGLRALVPREREEVFDELWERLDLGLKHWVRGILVSMTIMGTLTAIGLALAGVQDWFLLGVLTFFGTFVPYLGAIASAVPGLLLALSQSTGTFFAALVVYVAIHHIEGYLVQPFVMRRAVVIRPASLLIWQLVMIALLGIPGVVVATPLLACLKVTGGDLYVERKLGKRAAPVGGEKEAA